MPAVVNRPTKYLYVRIDAELDAAIKRACQERNFTRQSLAERALLYYLMPQLQVKSPV